MQAVVVIITGCYKHHGIVKFKKYLLFTLITNNDTKHFTLDPKIPNLRQMARTLINDTHIYMNCKKETSQYIWPKIPKNDTQFLAVKKLIYHFEKETFTLHSESSWSITHNSAAIYIGKPQVLFLFFLLVAVKIATLLRNSSPFVELLLFIIIYSIFLNNRQRKLVYR